MKRHVIVVGAGAFGGWTALMLLRAGFRVTLVDAWGPGNSRASSGGETRIIRTVYGGTADYSHMAARAWTLWHDAEKHWQRQVLFPTGALWLFDGDNSYLRSSVPHIEAAGLSIEQIDPAEAARRYPQMRFDDVQTAFFEPTAGFIAARTACELVRETFVREGGRYIESWAKPGEIVNGRVAAIALADGSAMNADDFVFACGPWMADVFPDVIGRRIVATRQEVFFFGTPADAQFNATALPVWVHMGKRFVYGLPSHEGRGLKIADDTPGEEMNPTDADRTPSAAAIERARAVLHHRFPALADAPLLESRVCQYESTSDRHFLVDRHPEIDNVWLVGGGSGHGFKMGPALGEHVAALIQERAETNPLFAYERLHVQP